MCSFITAYELYGKIIKGKMRVISKVIFLGEMKKSELGITAATGKKLLNYGGYKAAVYQTS